MSELLRAFGSYIRNTHDGRVQVVTADGLTDEEDMPVSQPSYKTSGAEIVEGQEFNTLSVGGPAQGKLAFFMDGIERTYVPAFTESMPIVYGYVAAVVRERRLDRKMYTYVHESDEGLYIPYGLVDIDIFEQAGVATKDSLKGRYDSENAPMHPMALRECARDAIKEDRASLEKKVSTRWLRENLTGDRWLMVDGTLAGGLGGSYTDYEQPNIVGVIKSHATQYFPLEEQRRILAMEAGERSIVFRPKEQRTEAFSWYLRLWSSAGKDPYYGLIRIEAPADDRTIDMADDISGWLLAERSPLSLPDKRWDRMIYPIKDCEQYLRSQAPTFTMISASVAI